MFLGYIWNLQAGFKFFYKLIIFRFGPRFALPGRTCFAEAHFILNVLGFYLLRYSNFPIFRFFFQVEILARIVLKVIRNFCHKNLGKLLQFLLSHATDEAEAGAGGGIITRHLPQGDIAKNDVRRHATLLSQLVAQSAQPAKERLIALDFTHALFA